MQVLPAEKQEKNCTERYSKGSRNQNWENFVNLYGEKSFETQVILQLGIYL